MNVLPKTYGWLNSEPGPRILCQALALYGTMEKQGSGSNPEILSWAQAVGLGHVYRSDDTAWCGLTMAYAALQAGWDIPVNPLGARNWLSWGTPQEEPALGDVLVFWRGSPKGPFGHVGLYVGDDTEAFHVLGGNQGDAVTIKRISRSRLLGARRCPWRVNQPGNVRRVVLAASGALSSNEA